MEKNYYQGCAGGILPHEIEAFDFSASNFIIEEKYDGIYCMAHFDKDGKVTLWSRNMKEKNNAQLMSLVKYMEENIALHDSILCGELAFSTQAGTEYQARVGHSKMDVFDIAILNGEEITHFPLLERKLLIEEILGSLDGSWILSAPYRHVRNAADVRDLYEHIVARGGEGLVVKDLNDKQYRPGGKSPLWYKIKKQLTMDYVICGFSKTNSAAYAKKGFVGGVICGLYVNGNLVEKVTVGSMSDDQRLEFGKNGDAYIGKVVEVAGFEVFDSGSMRHPSFVRVRDDKDAKECVWAK